MSDILKDNMMQIKKFNSKATELQNSLDEVKGLVLDNISKVMDRA